MLASGNESLRWPTAALCNLSLESPLREAARRKDGSLMGKKKFPCPFGRIIYKEVFNFMSNGCMALV